MNRFTRATTFVADTRLGSPRFIAGAFTIGFALALVAFTRSSSDESPAVAPSRPAPAQRRAPRARPRGWASIIEASSFTDVATSPAVTTQTTLATPDGGSPLPPRHSLDPSTAFERTGYLADRHARWASESEDRAASDDVKDYLEEMFTDFHVGTRSASVSCTASLCRTEVVFTDALQLSRAAGIPADGARIGLATAIDGDVARAVVYWDRDVDELPF